MSQMQIGSNRLFRVFTTSWVLAMMQFYRSRRGPCVNTSDHAEPGHAARSTSRAFETAWAVHTTVESSLRLRLLQTYDD
jgi:hypothetical protein